MRLRYSLYKYKLHENPNAYKARLVVGNRVATIKEVADMMVAQGSTVGHSDIVAVLEELVVALERLLAMGFRIHLPFANFDLTIQGVFDGADDEFDPHRHGICISITPGARLRKDMRYKIELSKDQQALHRPEPMEYFDLDSGEKDHRITPGGVSRVTGARLDFEPSDPQQGIFFVDQDHRAVRAEFVIEHKDRELLFKVPPLPSGTYRLEVRAYIYKSPQVRSGELGKLLIVP